MLTILGLVLLSAGYELFLVRAFIVYEDGNYAMCVFELPVSHQVMWVTIHQIIAALNFLLPLLINIGCTCTIVLIVIKIKVNIQMTKTKWKLCASFVHPNKTEGERVTVALCLANTNTGQNRRNLFQNVLQEHSEMITRPAITLVPSIFSLFSLPRLIVSFSLGCQSLEASPLRYLLITCYFIGFIPQSLTFCLYIYPSSFYWREWRVTTIGKRLALLRQGLRMKTFSTTRKN